MRLRVCMMGAPGAGKGTQARRLSLATGLPHVSTGQIFRNHVLRGSTIGREIAARLERGLLAPDALTNQVLEERLTQPDARCGFILDGFPRTLQQAEWLDDWLERHGCPLDIVLDLAVSDSEIVKRLASRRECPRCGTVKSVPPGLASVVHCEEPGCDGVVLVQRPDDREDTVRERLRIYHEVSEPLKRFYAAKRLLTSIPADGLGPDALFESITELLSRRVAVASQ